MKELAGLETRLPKISDYVLYLRSAAHYGMQDYTASVSDLTPLWSRAEPTPVTAKAAMTAAHAYMDAKQPKDAAEILRRYIDSLPSPQGMFLLAQAAEAMGDPIAAATHYDSVYYWSPTTPEAAQAGVALDRLRQTLGANFPPTMPATMFARADRLLRGGQPKEAKKEYEALAASLGGTDRDVARVRIGVADQYAGKHQDAYDYLKSLSVSDADADAERLYYEQAAARKLDRDDDVIRIANEIGQAHPTSHRHLEALIAAANYFIVNNDAGHFQPLYKTCFESFPNDPQASYCHWRYLWPEYLNRKPDALALMREHLKKYPSSEKAAAALYFAGRLSEKAGERGAAREYYTACNDRFGNFYHAVLARERLQDSTIAHAAPSSAVREFLAPIRFPSESAGNIFESNAATNARIERSRLLVGAGLDDWAESELRFGAKTDSKPGVIAIELATQAIERDAPEQSIHAIKAYASGYLSLPVNAAPERFWKLGFPLPPESYHLQEWSRDRSLDPYLVAALIRQESEFNPKVVSHAGAYGLMQVMPSTGRGLARRVGIPRFRASVLFDPSTNIKMGTYYLRSVIDQFDGKLEPALASYNAGKTRVVRWLAFGQYEEPAEFVETIPFTETRNYVQVVLRNADVYRRLYGSKTARVTSTNGHRTTDNSGAE